MTYSFYTPFFLLTVISYQKKEENYLLNLPILARYRDSKLYFYYLKKFVFYKIRFTFENEIVLQRISLVEFYKLKELGTPEIKPILEEELQQA